MARNLAQRLDRLERLIRERTATGPLFLREGKPIPDGVDPERVTFIQRQTVDAPEREPLKVPEIRL
jgi:UDP-glucose 6-dehydrogenase